MNNDNKTYIIEDNRQNFILLAGPCGVGVLVETSVHEYLQEMDVSAQDTDVQGIKLNLIAL